MPDELTIRLLLRITARISCLLFLAVFGGPSLQALQQSEPARWLRSHRPHLLLAFAGSHTLHLGAIVLLIAAEGARFFRARGTAEVLIVGGALFAVIYALAFSAVAELRGRVPLWPSPRFQSFFMYVLWVVFALAFVPRAVREPMVYGTFSLVVLTALAIRLAARFRRTARARGASA